MESVRSHVLNLLLADKLTSEQAQRLIACIDHQEQEPGYAEEKKPPKESPLLVRVKALMLDGMERTALEIAKTLQTSKKGVNRVLYGNRQVFGKTPNQLPPRWKMRSE